MTDTILNRSLVAALLASVAIAPAAARDGAVYVGVEGGLLRAGDIDFDVGATGGDNDDDLSEFTVEHSYGYDVGGFVGYDFGAFRAELEVTRKVAELTNIELDNLSSPILGGGSTGAVTLPPGRYSDGMFTNAGGSTRIWTGMANLLFDIGGDDSIGFSIGGGAGIAQIEADIYQLIEPGIAFIDDKTEDFAFQGLAQLRYPLGRAVDLGVKYRYFNIPSYSQTTFDGQTLDGEFDSHSLLASLTFNFGGAEPAPPPPPPVPAAAPPPPAPVAPPPPAPPAVADNFIVFFDWDQSDITPEAADTLNRAAQSYRDGGQTSITLAGHADKSGPADYNVGLSQRRADAVRDYLTGQGLPEGAISTEAFGESRPLVETADGVREPQNRRVEIMFGGAGM